MRNTFASWGDSCAGLYPGIMEKNGPAQLNGTAQALTSPKTLPHQLLYWNKSILDRHCGLWKDYNAKNIVKAG